MLGDIGVDGVGEIEWQSPLGEVVDIAFGRKNEDAVAKEVN